MKGRLNPDGYVMDFGDVKNVAMCVFCDLVRARRVQEVKSEIPASHVK